MSYEITEKPVIHRRVLKDTSLQLTINSDSKRLTIESLLEDELTTGGINRSRPRLIIRDAEYELSLNRILPDDDHVVWTNPRRSMMTILLEFLAEGIKAEVIE